MRCALYELNFSRFCLRSLRCLWLSWNNLIAFGHFLLLLFGFMATAGQKSQNSQHDSSNPEAETSQPSSVVDALISRLTLAVAFSVIHPSAVALVSVAGILIGAFFAAQDVIELVTVAIFFVHV